MTDHGTARPYLPDPQRDRHVSFPDEPSDQRSRMGSLPPEAWAPRPSGPPSPTEGRGHQSVPSFLTTPARRPPVPRRSNNRGAALIAALVVVPLFFGIVNSGASGSSSEDGGGYSVQEDGSPWPGSDGGPYGGIEGVVIEPVADKAKLAAPLPPATTVQGVPADTTQVRIEVVASASDTVQLEVSGPDGVIEATVDEPLPLARIASHAPERRTTMHVHATPASGDTELQCRIYAGTVLVALDTGRSNVTCTVTW